MTAFARIQRKPAFIFGHLKYLRTQATASAPSASDLPAFLVLLFLQGASGFRQMNTSPHALMSGSRCDFDGSRCARRQAASGRRNRLTDRPQAADRRALESLAAASP